MSTPFAVTAYEPPPPPRHFSVEEYLEREAVAEAKSEYLDGVVCAMPSASPRHLVVESELNFRVRGQIGDRGPCVYLNGNVQIVIPGVRTYVYPDGAIACPPQFAPELPTAALTNPRVIFEILSPSTEGYDRRGKFRHYKTIKTFEDYVLISTDEPSVEVFSRSDDWKPKGHEGLDAVAIIPSVGIELPLVELYALTLTVPE